MNSINQITLIGRLGKDPELKKISEERSLAKLVVATDHSWFNKKKGESGDWESETTWHNVTIWDPSKTIREAKKGRMVYIQGRYTTRTWDDEKGVKHYFMEVVATSNWALPKTEGKAFQSEQEKEAKNAESPPDRGDVGFPDQGPDDLPF